MIRQVSIAPDGFDFGGFSMIVTRLRSSSFDAYVWTSSPRQAKAFVRPCRIHHLG